MLDLKRIVLELQRRRVLRTVAACIVAGWVALQVADLAFASLELPQFALRRVWITLCVCFPLALIFPWCYDISGQCIRRSSPSKFAGRDELALRRSDLFVLGAALITNLSTIAGLRVVSRTSSVRVDDTLSLPEVAASSRESKAVEGSVTRERAAFVLGVRPHQRLRPCRRAGTIGASVRRVQIEVAS